MHAPHLLLLLLERTLEPAVAELVRLGLLCTLVVCIALIVLAVCMLAVNVGAAWGAAHASPASFEAWSARASRVRPIRPAPRMAATTPLLRSGLEPAGKHSRPSLRLIAPDVLACEPRIGMKDT